MRIIGGRLKRRVLPSNTKLNVRPTTDMAKEALFNIINNDFSFDEIKVLDLFSGTGSISIEFASREAIEVIAVDLENKCINHLKNIANKLEISNIKAVRNDSLHFLEVCKVSFDIIFADPPYDYKLTHRIPEIVMSRKLLNEDGWLIVEHSQDLKLNSYQGFFQQRKYGKVNFSFFKNT